MADWTSAVVKRGVGGSSWYGVAKVRRMSCSASGGSWEG
jgi:hypothetical protein